MGCTNGHFLWKKIVKHKMSLFLKLLQFLVSAFFNITETKIIIFIPEIDENKHNYNLKSLRECLKSRKTTFFLFGQKCALLQHS